jgi:hypothetical protein
MQQVHVALAVVVVDLDPLVETDQLQVLAQVWVDQRVTEFSIQFLFPAFHPNMLQLVVQEAHLLQQDLRALWVALPRGQMPSPILALVVEVEEAHLPFQINLAEKAALA